MEDFLKRNPWSSWCMSETTPGWVSKSTDKKIFLEISKEIPNGMSEGVPDGISKENFQINIYKKVFFKKSSEEFLKKSEGTFVGIFE